MRQLLTLGALLSLLLGSAPPALGTPEDGLLDLAIDGVRLYDGHACRTLVGNTVIPRFVAHFDSATASVNDVSSIGFVLARRRDGIAPVVPESAKHFAPATGTFWLLTPFDQDSILYLGDTHLELSWRDAAGGRRTRRFGFCIGGRDLRYDEDWFPL